MALSLSKGRVRGPTDRRGSRRHNAHHTSKERESMVVSQFEMPPPPALSLEGEGADIIYAKDTQWHAALLDAAQGGKRAHQTGQHG